MSEINTELRQQVEGLFDGQPPTPEAFDDTTPVTVEMTKGQAYTIRALLRMDADGYLQTLQMMELFGELKDDDIDAVNDSLAGTMALENLLSAVAPTADYPQPAETQADYALTV